MQEELTEFQKLNRKLIEHYNCFNTERFYLDELNEKQHFVSIVTSSIQDHCPIKLCRNIARYVKKHLPKTMQPPFIYVGAYAFPANKL